MRRMSGILMIALVMVLQIIPCSDAFALDLTDYNQTEFSQASMSSHSGDHDVCSPFCCCGCCAVPVVVRPAMTADFVNTFSVRVYTVYLMPALHKLPKSLWQPPRLS